MATKGLAAQLKSRNVAPVRVETVIADRPKVGSYARISDATALDGSVDEQGVNRQIKANQLIAGARDWEIEAEYIDNDVSAYKVGVVRPAWEEMLADLASGRISGVVCYNLDRFARQVSDLERAVAIFDAAKRAKREMYFATAEGDLNLASDDGLTMARVMVAFANKSSRDTARRLSSKWAEQRDAGLVKMGMRPFGWNPVTDTGRRTWVLNEYEAGLVRAAVDDLMTHTATFSTIASRWNDLGALTTRGKNWQPGTVRQYMSSPRLAGWLVHDNKIATHSQTGEWIRSEMPPILTDDEFELLYSTIIQETTVDHGDRDGRRKHLLSGILRCGLCSAPLTGSRQVIAGKAYHYYLCRTNNRTEDGVGVGCGKLSISGAGMDEMVVKLVLPRIVEASKDASYDAADPNADEIAQLKSDKAAELARYHANAATAEMVLPKLTRIDKRLDQLRKARAIQLRDQRTMARSAAVTEENWSTLSIEEQTAHIARFITAIYIGPATKRGNRFDASRVSRPVFSALWPDGESSHAG